MSSETSYRSGYMHGASARSGVQHNVSAFFGQLHAAGYAADTVLGLARARADIIRSPWRDELAGIADGARVSFDQVLAYNLYRDLVSPDECTVSMAVGHASASGDTVFAKNSDKVGGKSLVGPNFYKNKEINVILYAERDDGLKIIGVCAAGSTGLKMGMNNRGLAAGCNIARTQELDEKNMDLTKIRALDRAYLLRIGLEQSNVLDATRGVTAELMASPMATPGNIQFADARQAFLIEGSYDRLAVKKIADDVDSRSNRFITLEYMNKKDDVSSYCRYYRTQEILKSKKGKMTLDDLVQISMDHANGPGPNSICRHGTQFTEEISLAAMVMALDGKDPSKSRWGICLGKPCHAWRDPEGHFFGDMSTPRSAIPEGFFNGAVFKKFYQEEPKFA